MKSYLFSQVEVVTCLNSKPVLNPLIMVMSASRLIMPYMIWEGHVSWPLHSDPVCYSNLPDRARKFTYRARWSISAV